MFMRIAKAKNEAGLGKNEEEALLILCKDHLEKNRESMPAANAMLWRRQNIWNEPVDNILKAYQPFFTELYKRYSSSKQPGKPITMDNDDLVSLCSEAEGLISEDRVNIEPIADLNRHMHEPSIGEI